jgi:hypothetical protein
MIVYKDLFAFATAPNTGEVWFTEAYRKMGLVFRGYSCPCVIHPCLAHEKFQPEAESLLKVSLARNPYEWLHYVWAAGVCEHDERFGTFSKSMSWLDYLDWYLAEHRGDIGRLILSYEADSYIRFEDLPDGLRELRSSLGIKGTMMDLLPPWVFSSYGAPTDKSARRSVCDAEKEMCDAFDYW